MTFFTTSANNCLFLPFLFCLFGPCCCCFFFLSLLSIGPFCFLSLLSGPFLLLSCFCFLSVSFFFSGCFFVSFFLSWGLPCCPFLESAMAFASFLCSAAQTLFLLHAASSFLQASVGLPPPPFWAFALHSISFLHNAFFWQAFLSASNSLLPSFLGCGLGLALSFLFLLLPSFLGCGLGLAFLFLFMTFFTTSANNCLFLPFLFCLFGPCCFCFFFLSLLSIGPFCF